MSRPDRSRRLLAALLAAVLPSLAGVSASAEEPVQIQPHRTRWERLETWRLRVRVDFGPETRVEPGTEPCDNEDWSPYAAWTGGMVRSGNRPAGRDAFLGDFIEGESAVLLVPVEAGRSYRMILTLGDAEAPRGPVRITQDGRVLVDSLRTGPGEFLDVVFDVTPVSPRVELGLDAGTCGSFAANGIALFSTGVPPGRKPRRSANREPAPVPARADADSLSLRARAALERYAEYLLARQPAQGGFSHNGNWYECAYPVRTLLWASRLLGEPRYARAALACLDRFLSEQRTDGFWSAHYFASVGCPMARATLEEGRSRNLADIGSLALCLPLASTFVEPEEASRLVGAARAYADGIVLPAQLPGGAFPNGRFEGVEYAFPYSVATAVQASHLAVLHLVTGDARYREASLRAGLFLAASVESDGSVRLHRYDKDETLLLPAERVGDLFYVIEALLWVHRIADAADRTTLAAALDRYFRGGSLEGLWADPAAWLGGGDVWERSKRAGILYLLEGYGSVSGRSPDLDALVARVFGALEDPGFAPRVGVTAVPGTAQERYAMAATGFAGLGAIGLADPGGLPGFRPR